MQLTKLNTVKVALTSCLAFVVVSCGKEEENFDLYTIEKAEPRSLELIIEASGSVEAISSIEIKSNDANKKYLQTKRDKLGHLLSELEK